ncbi:ribosome biogenesis GTPase Der [Labrys monachus]|uniref:GTPase Der n=1 Tax=Labrys monachus TaxID=217067 RepID=A0ABU0FG13_9HYPH|nr:ribosome biogenesis GTPase Der [Labrys monachus]MDQ0393548.1 GTP-binding protein [Labrys monachus]
MSASIAIVGRPNVGKSTLFNRLVGRKLAIVDDRPGVTRDRREGDARLGHLSFKVIDTAGLEVAEDASLAGRMRAQTEAAIALCDLVLFMIDARAGLTPADEHFAEVARRSGKPVIVVANKTESRTGFQGAYEGFSLGLGDPVPISAEHGEGMADLEEAIAAILPAAANEAEEDVADTDAVVSGEEGEEEAIVLDAGIARPLRVAIIGRPNAGKSTLINALIGQDRLLTGPEAGITRDTISVDWTWRDKRIKLFDTAGMRKKARIEDKLEKLSVSDGLRAVRFAEVVVLLLDSAAPFEKQDLQIADLVEREGRALVVALNKWDLVENRNKTLADAREMFERLLPQLRGAPLVTLSGLSEQGLDRLMEATFRAFATWNRRVPTAKLNRWLGGVLEHHPPPAVSGRRIKIRYMTQVKTRPPHFAVFGNQLDALPESFLRYLVNGLRDTFDMPGVPIRLSMRSSRNPFDRKSKSK